MLGRTFIRATNTDQPPPLFFLLPLALVTAWRVAQMSATGRQIALGYGTTQLYDGMLDIYRYCRRYRCIPRTEKKSECPRTEVKPVNQEKLCRTVAYVVTLVPSRISFSVRQVVPRDTEQDVQGPRGEEEGSAILGGVRAAGKSSVP